MSEIDRDFVFRTVKYVLIGSIAMLIVFILSFIAIVNTFFIIEKPDAVPVGGAGSANTDVSPGDKDIESGCVYLKATTTPSIGVHNEHAVI